MTEFPILIVEDDESLREAVETTLSDFGFHCLSVDNARDAKRLLSQKQFSLLLTDVQLPGEDGYTLLLAAKALWPAMPVVLMTAYATTENAVKALHHGAKDYIEKPFSSDRLLDVVRRYAKQAGNPDGITAHDPAMQRLLQVAEKVAPSPATVLLTGESGTGKEVFAHFIHDKSERKSGPFVALNCASIPNDLLESILFGHAKGAFTGAHVTHTGKIQQANGGTLFLDEIAEMPAALQAKILRVLQEREIEPIGAKAPIPIDVRFIAATHRHLPDEIAKGTFRADLFYRLNVFPIGLPALRDRTADILPLAASFIRKHGPSFNKDNTPIHPSAQQALLEYSWPGNVRELENTIQRALILCTQEITKEDLGLPLAPEVKKPAIKPLSEMEREAIVDAIHVFQGDVHRAADALKIPYRSLAAKIKTLSISTIKEHQ